MDLKGCHFAAVIRSDLQFSWRDEREAKWETAIRRWHTLIIDNVLVVRFSFGASSYPGGDVQRTVTGFGGCVLQQISCNASQKMCWAESYYQRLEKLGRSFPCTEEGFYDFMCRQRDEGAPSSRMKSC